jgi:hypothetical protein
MAEAEAATTLAGSEEGKTGDADEEDAGKQTPGGLEKQDSTARASTPGGGKKNKKNTNKGKS